MEKVARQDLVGESSSIIAPRPQEAPPVFFEPLPDHSSLEDEPVYYFISSSSYFDPNEQAVTLSATLADGSPLPSWLSFTQTPFDVDLSGYQLTGTPPPNFNTDATGPIQIRITASDTSTPPETTSDIFDLFITAVPDAPTITDLEPEVTFPSNMVSAPQLLDANVVFNDPDGIANGTLVVDGLLPEDRVGVRNEGVGPGQIGVSDGEILFGGTSIGTFSGGNGDPFVVSLNGAATVEAVDSLIQNLTYFNVSASPTPTRDLQITVFDGGRGGLSSNPGTYVQLIGADNPFDGFQANYHSAPVFIDIDGDGDLDAVVGDYYGDSLFLLVNDLGTFTQADNTVNPFDNLFETSFVTPTFIDYDEDNDLDLIYGNSSGQLGAFRNDGGVFTEVSSDGPFFNTFFYDKSRSAPTPYDVDGDGNLDLVIGYGDGTINYLLNYGGFFDQPFASGFNPFSGIDVGSFAAPYFVDVDGDGILDLVVGDGDGRLHLFQNTDGWLEVTGANNPFNGIDVGFNATPTFVDLDGNGDLELVVGNSEGTLQVFDNPNTAITVIIGPSSNNSPILAVPIADFASPEDQGFSYTLNSGAFTDPDGDALTYSASLASGQPLPSWLIFDPSTRTFSGTPPLNFNGPVSVRVTASDGSLSASDTFDLVIQPVNDAPVLVQPAPDLSTPEETPITFRYPSTAFTDVDGDPLTYTVTAGSGGTLSFNGDTGEYTLTPNLNFNGPIVITVVASDGQASAIDRFNVVVTPVNDAPFVGTPIEDYRSPEDQPVNYALDQKTFGDVDGDTLTYTAALTNGSPLPTWLVFNPTTRTFTGTPPQDFNGAFSIRVTASDGQASASDDFTLIIDPVNDAPVVANPIADHNSPEDQPVSYQLPVMTFRDVDNDPLTYSATLSNGSALPAWLTFNPATRTFTGTPPANFNGAFSVRVTASDGSLSASDDFILAIDPVNDAPVVLSPIPDHSSPEDQPVTYQVPAATFFDVDGDLLTYSATLSNGATLPAWLSFDPSSRTFTGTPPRDFNGSFSVRVTASDGNVSASDDFLLVIQPVNDAPVLASPIADQRSPEDQPFSYQLPVATFQDVDGDTLTYSATQTNGSPLPSWLNFNPINRTFTGTPPADFNGAVSVRVTASDGSLSASDDFNLTIDPVNDAPVVANPIADFTSPEDQPLSYQLAAITFFDVDGDALTYSARLADGQPLPAWLTFDPISRTFSGTPPQDFNGRLPIRVVASDGSASASDIFDLIIDPVNDAPVLADPIEDYFSTEDQFVSYQLPAGTFTDVDGDVLTYQARLSDGAPLPVWLSFDPQTLTFSGQPPANFNGVLTVQLSASDGLASASDLFDIVIRPANDDVMVAHPIEDRRSPEDQPLTFTLPDDVFIDIDGDRLTYSAALASNEPLPSWLTFNPETLTFSGTPPANFNGRLSISVTASDGEASASDIFDLIIDPVNDAPILANPIADLSSPEDQAVSYQLPVTTFTDVDGDTLTYSARLVDGGALPAWLTFDPATRTFTGTPPANFNGTFAIRVTASDGLATASDDFSLAITPVNDAPVLAEPIADRHSPEDQPFSYQLPATSFSDVDGDALTYSAALADGQPLPAWLSFDPTTRTFSGTPPLDFNGSLAIRVTASDGSLSASDLFDLIIDPVNDAPVLANPIADYRSPEDQPFSYQILTTAFSDVDGDRLTYSATLSDGSALPAWLSFDPLSRTFSGTPPLDFNGLLSIRVVASDGTASAVDLFDLIIDPVNDAPTLAVPIPEQHSPEDQPFSLQLPANTFADVDGDTLTLSASLASDQPLPAWLSFDPVTRTFSGTPPTDFNGTIVVRVVASDGQASVATSFNLVIDPVNDAPRLPSPLDDQRSPEDQPVDFRLSPSAFIDVDGDALTYTATLAGNAPLPSWLSFDASTLTFKGTPPANFNGSLSLLVTASDGSLSTTAPFTLFIDPVDDAPFLLTPIPDQRSLEDQAFAFDLPSGTFGEVDGEALSLTATLGNGDPLPLWLRFDPTSGRFAGTPPENFNGTITVRVAASDGLSSIADLFNLIVEPVNDAVILAAPLADRRGQEDQPVIFQAPANSFIDPDGDALTYEASLASNDPLPDWLTFNSANLTFRGTPPLNFNGSLAIRLTASDGSTRVSDVFDLVINPVNDAPIILGSIAMAQTEAQIGDYMTGTLRAFDVDGSLQTLSLQHRLVSGSVRVNGVAVADDTIIVSTRPDGSSRVAYMGSTSTGADVVTFDWQAVDSAGAASSIAHATMTIFGGGARSSASLPRSANGSFVGTAGNDDVSGDARNDTLLLTQSGDDRAFGFGGDDGFYFGAAYTRADRVDGGAGIDSLALQGNYAGLTFGEIYSTEVLVFLSGADTRFGDVAGNVYDYAVATREGNVRPGAILTVQADGLRPGEDLVFDGRAESDGQFRIFAGRGNDVLLGGAGNDGFFFGADGNLTGLDRVFGGAGADSLALRGNYVGDRALVFSGSTMNAVENLVLLSGLTTEFGGLVVPSGFDYDITLADGNVASGAMLTIHALPLAASESVRIDGRAETNGSLRILSGSGDDQLTGGAGSDLIYGGLGRDVMDGGLGSDIYLYRSVAESSPAAPDQIMFASGDRLDLRGIDANAVAAGDQAFNFVGSAAFSGAAGEVRAFLSDGRWIVEADVNGDSVADLTIHVIKADPLVGADFLF